VTAILWLLALLAALCPAATAEQTGDIYVLTTNGSAVLTDETGGVLVRPGEYAEIGRLGGSGLYAARPLSGGGLGVIRADGTAVTAFEYSALEYDGGRIVFTRDGRCGVMDTSGSALIEPLYTRLISAGESGWLALKSDPLDDTPDSLWRVTPDGAEQPTGVKLSYGPLAFSDGLAEAVDMTGRWGYLDAEGGWAVEPRFSWCGPFRDGAACAAEGDGMGLVGRSGAWIVPPVYVRLERGAPQMPLIGFEEGAVSLVSPQDGAVIARFAGAGADAGYTGALIRVSAGGRLCLVDGQGAVVREAEEGVVGLQERGGCVIEQRSFSEERPYGFIGADGARHGDWQELSFAGSYRDRMYFIFSEYETVRSEYAGQGLVFYDEVLGTRRYGLVNDEGDVMSAGFISLRRTGRALLTAETENWIGLIRPDGTVIMSLEKAE